MIRKIGAAAVALLCIAGLAAGAEAEAPSAAKTKAKAPAAERSVVATHGHYTGMDHQQRTITFTYEGNEVKNFRVGHLNLHNAHVSGAAWHERCADDRCFKGHWVTDTEVVGFWRDKGGHWVPWNAFLPKPRTNFQGNYSGWDHQDNSIRMTRHNDFVQHFTVTHNGRSHTYPSVRVNAHGAWTATCDHTFCYSGHWQDDYHVVGYWWRKNEHHKVAWEAHAYSAR